MTFLIQQYLHMTTEAREEKACHRGFCIIIVIFRQDQFTQPTRQFTNVFSQYPVLPKIPANNNQTETSDRKSVTDNQQQHQQQQQQQQQQQPQQQQPVTDNEDAFLPKDPILLTDYEEERLAEQIRTQLGGDAVVDKLKLLYQQLAAYDPDTTYYVHYSIVRSVAYQLGVKLFNSF